MPIKTCQVIAAGAVQGYTDVIGKTIETAARNKSQNQIIFLLKHLQNDVYLSNHIAKHYDESKCQRQCKTCFKYFFLNIINIKFSDQRLDFLSY